VLGSMTETLAAAQVVPRTSWRNGEVVKGGR
jgi:hypothetical protein